MSNNYSYVFNAHPTFIEEMFKKYQNDPSQVEDGWRAFFEGFEFNQGVEGESSTTSVDVNGAIIENPVKEYGISNFKEFGVLNIIHAFRHRGHLLSTTNPIRRRRDHKPHLNISDYGLDQSDLNKTFKAGEVIGLNGATLQQIIDRLHKIYSGHIGFQYSHIENREIRTWLRNKIENRSLESDFGLDIETKKQILKKLNGAVVFEQFLHTKYIGQKRFSLEGGETTIAALDAIITAAAKDKVEEVTIGMAHRGRLNVLANIMQKTYEQIFSEFEGTAVPEHVYGDGDVKYHLGYSSQVKVDDKTVHLKLAPNPSHLESVDPVLEGFSRAKADILYDSEYDRILPILIHGDAAAAGQGVVYETAQMSMLEGYHTGGTLHFVINNQIGFTTDYDDARSSTYCSAAGQVIQAPIFHVNGDDPEAVVYAALLAIEFRQKFNQDVWIDMVCYRKHGHNEGDDPSFTQPQMYHIIKKHQNPRELYVKLLSERGDIDQTLAKELEETFWNELQARLDMVKQESLPYEYQEPEQAWRALKRVSDISDFEKNPKTSITKNLASHIVEQVMKLPEDFNPLGKVNRLLKGKKKLLANNQYDWAMGEWLGFGSILMEGKNVRMSGQDVKRGTFSHRHAIFNDVETFEEYNRFSNLSDDQGKLRIYNSLLSEFAVLGFEYGYSLATPNDLVIWEAQFGDFYNGAQTIVDQFISAAESKWGRMSGLVMLLPHGYEGQGPEHSSARLERFLQLCAEFNMIITNVSTPANLFHALRRQVTASYRKPLVNMSPKSLLRHPLCVSQIDDFTGSTKFLPVINDEVSDAAKAKKLIFCTGKVYYDLYQRREELGKEKEISLVRIEQLYPFPANEVNKIINDHAKANDILWVQEEPENMGAWHFIMSNMRRSPIEVIARKHSASPATGFKSVHLEQQEAILDEAIGKK